MNTAEQKSPLDMMIADLAKSGLTFEDVFTRVLDGPERNMLELGQNALGYIIPYYNLFGKQLPYYRAKVFNSEPKYRQVKNTPNHVYFPPTFWKVFQKVKGTMVILTEGEKKAALMCKLGIPAVAFGGVDSWSNRTILLPKQTELSSYSYNRNIMAAKLPNANVEEANLSPLAIGFNDLMDVCLKHKTTFYIVFDTDSHNGLSAPVQRAAAKLGYELRFKGFQIGQIRQLILPYVEHDDLEKIGLDDFLMHEEDGGIKEFMTLLEKCSKSKSAFPRHPNIREHLNKQLQRPKLDRKQMQNLSLSLVTEMDARGKRMYSTSQSQLYYFDGNSKILMKVNINGNDPAGQQETPFGRLLYRDYGISPAADQRLFQWIGSQFAAEDPIEDVEPHRIICQPRSGEDILRYQINDGAYIKVTGDTKFPFQIVPNGTDTVLFESGLVKDIDTDQLKVELGKRLREPLTMWWGEVLKGVRLKEQGMQATIVSLLYYISPWLNRWRGMQLPVELIVGEAGSGKSTLAEIRLNIIAGEAKLRNAPTDMKDWYASIANSGGLHVTDNVHLVDKNLKQRMSDELCRLVTDPNSRIEMRKYFTEADLRSIHVGAVFAFTAIQQPFLNADLLQRAVLLELDKSIADIKDGSFTFDSFWKEAQLTKYGGRAAWVSHHMHVLHLFFKKVAEKWDPHYRSKHRLVNFEQSLVLMAEVFGIETEWIPDFLMNTANSTVGRSDWTLEGLIEWAHKARKHKLGPNKTWTAADISGWAEDEDDFSKNYTLTNTRALGKYMQTNKHNLIAIVGMEEVGKKDNRMHYKVLAAPISYDKRPNEALLPST